MNGMFRIRTRARGEFLDDVATGVGTQHPFNVSDLHRPLLAGLPAHYVPPVRKRDLI